MQIRPLVLALSATLLAACGSEAPAPEAAAPAAPAVAPVDRFVGTTEPFASEAVYFVVTDRFVNGDPSNDHRDQGGANRTFDIPLKWDDGRTDNVGYLGGDFKGLLDHAGYIREMGFSALWITPIVDNPDEAFTGGDPITQTSFLTDRGKSGYHGYWAKNFYTLDEHLPSEGLDFRAFTAAMQNAGLKIVLDIVANHGSPGWSMPVDQKEFGRLYDASGNLIADHGNLPPEQLDPANNPLHVFYNVKPDLAQLSDFNEDNPAVMDHLVGAYLQWIEQGAYAFRVDTVRHVKPEFWRLFAERIRAKHPGFFMFGEVFDYEAAKTAIYTHPENGGMSVLDFALKKALLEVFENEGSDFATLAPALYLKDGPYANPYELMTFYDNHDMARMNASDAGFINAHHWLFTARGIPVIYYGSEIGFERGAVEHNGNRNYFGVEGIEAARTHPIRQGLIRVAQLRARLPALQRGLQFNLKLEGDEAAFYRVLQTDDTHQTALVLLNKSAEPRAIALGQHLQPGEWKDAESGEVIKLGSEARIEVPANGLRVLLWEAPLTDAALLEALRAQAGVAPLSLGRGAGGEGGVLD
ncbi:alpha-amylase family glycosyl hydrolase [uncultured Aquimonas sp.]|uniref:alpha-amylase family glycosyl hydrolase n=1 Tax=uncultured Aquimonas sp. TaxID=385483 RepID=UPI0008697740|nr:alpha-amylase family glycosyl hydrolase [uncultured Aquimonas sp.]ODU47916.1 MAG: cyclomaltodextrin glucanotransferase [Xanthomonadaceae bacterium SCN 69-123]